MGTLYYFAKHDGSRELFALNKVYHYERVDHDGTAYQHPLRAAFDDAPVRLADVVATPEEFGERFIAPEYAEWGVTIGRRLFAWAGDAQIQFISEHEYEEFHEGLSYDEHRMLITGSSYDSDYEDDGVTYIPGHAW